MAFCGRRIARPAWKPRSPGVMAALLLVAWTYAALIQAQQLPRPGEPAPRVIPTQPPAATKPGVEVEVAPAAGAAPPGADTILVDFRGLNIEGVTVYEPQQLEDLYRDLIGTQITLAQVFQIADAIQQKYRDDGYVLARVVVPTQSVSDGFFRVRVVEGFISKITVEGDVGRVSKRVEAQLNEIITEGPANIKRLERYLLITNDIPGITVRGVLRPGTGEIGASELVVKVERKPFEAFAVVNNRGSEFTGPWRAGANLSHNSGTSLGERVDVFVATTLSDDEQRFIQASYQQNVGLDGLTFRLVGSYGPSEPGFTLKPLGVETEATFVDGSFRYPVIRSRRENLYVSGGLNFEESTVDILGTQISKNKLWVLHAALDYDGVVNWLGRYSTNVEVRQGLDIFGATETGDPDISPADGVSDFTLLRGFGNLYHPFNRNLGLLLATTGQYSFDTLMTDEECRLGGEQFGRGYDPSEIAGEHCFGFSAEMQYNGGLPIKLDPRYQPYGFYDFGVVWNEGVSLDSHTSIASAGIGVRTKVGKNWSFDFEIAKPLTKEVATEGNTDPRFFFQALVTFP